MLSRVSSRWNEGKDAANDEGQVKPSSHNDAAVNPAAKWARSTLGKTQQLAHAQRLEQERNSQKSAYGKASEAEHDRAAHLAALDRSYQRTFSSSPTTSTPAAPKMVVPSAPRSTADEPSLSSEQAQVLQMVVHERQSLMFTGGAGTGKSVLVRAIVKDLARKYGASRVAVTATTGIAALHIGGSTLHSWTGLGMANGDVKALTTMLSRGPKERRDRWRQTQVLIIDEVSMLDAALFDKLEAVARSVRRSEAPFGGIQLVLVGDFYQLPPVIKDMTNWKTDKAELRQAKIDHQELLRKYPSRLLFHAFQWHACVPVVVVLKTVFRQSDSGFVTMLEELRRNRMTSATIQAFYSLSRPIPITDGILPTELYPTRAEVSNSNESRLMALRTHKEIYVAHDISKVHGKGGAAQNIHEWLDKATIYPYHLELREKAQVMLVKNCAGDLVNGSRGIIVGFMPVSKDSRLTRRVGGHVYYQRPSWMQVENRQDTPVASHVDEKPRLNPPVPGKSTTEEPDEFDDPDMDAALEEAALSIDAKRPVSQLDHIHSKRAGSVPAGSSLSSQTHSARQFHRVQSDTRASASTQLKELVADQDLHRRALRRGETRPQGLLPARTATPASVPTSNQKPHLSAPDLKTMPRDEMNRFYIEVAVATGASPTAMAHVEEGKHYPVVRFVNGREYLVVPQEHSVEDHLGRQEGGRVQVPLILAWSMSIHKAQGMTLDKVSLDLSRSFERGQAYVALSRATNLDLLQVRGFHPGKVRTDPKVVEWEEQVVATQDQFLHRRAEMQEKEREQQGSAELKRKNKDTLRLTVKDNAASYSTVAQSLIDKSRSASKKRRF